MEVRGKVYRWLKVEVALPPNISNRIGGDGGAGAGAGTGGQVQVYGRWR